MESGQDPTAAEDADQPFVAVVRDSSGATFHVQAVPVFIASGRVLLGAREGPATGGLLGLLNRVLAKSSREKVHHGFGVMVYRDDPGGPIVAESDHGSMREARASAQVLVRAIENGTFDAS